MQNRSGFTLIEVLVALTLLSGVLLTMTSATTNLSRAALDASRSTAAVSLAQERLTMIRMDPAYAQLEARYAGVESSIPGFPGFVRETRFLVVSDPADRGRTLEYKRATVTVQGPGLERPISRTVAVTRE